MDRIQKYRESLHKFIRDKSCLIDKDINNIQINNLIYEHIKKDDLIFPILLLTIMNSQNKKNHITMQGYYLATCIEFINVLFEIVENRSILINKMGIDMYNKITRKLIINSTKSLQQNMKSIKNTYKDNPQTLLNVFINSMDELDNVFNVVNSFEDFQFILTNNCCNDDIVNWYLKNDQEMTDKFASLKQVSSESINSYISMKIESICELSILLGWNVGGGNMKSANKLKRISKYFAMMYKISTDFNNIDNDLKNATGYTHNYVLNFGLQSSYELFLSNKEKFIEELIIEDVYTGTIKEIINSIESNIDSLIDQTSPDLKSNYSSKN